jgi:hypothetical protein
MKGMQLLRNPIARNALGFLLLAAVHYASDQYSFHQREGLDKTSPYIFLLLMYGWIVFHNRILFERLYLRGKKLAYAIWTALFMLASSVNMYLIIHNVYHIARTLPNILSFWVYTITGLGIYVIFRYLHIIEVRPSEKKPDPGRQQGGAGAGHHFICTIDGIRKTIPCQEISFIESLENYIRIHGTQKKYLVRLTLKEAEERLPRSFIRISRSHIVNAAHITGQEGEIIQINELNFRIGKVYKRFVEDQLKRDGLQAR